MSKYSHALSWLLCLAILPAPIGSARATMFVIDGNEVLAEVDRRADVFSDQHYRATMEIERAGEVTKTLSFTSTMKGLDKQYIEFTAPGDIEGMKVLMLDASTLYLYSREFNKVRKVAAHAVKQGFMGSEFTFEDMTQIKLSPAFVAELGPREGTRTTLLLTPKPGTDPSYARLEVTIDSTQGGVIRIRYFDASGTAVREQKREDWVQIEGHPFPTRVVMNNLKTGNQTTIRLSDIAVNQGVDDSVFSRRQMLRE